MEYPATQRFVNDDDDDDEDEEETDGDEDAGTPLRYEKNLKVGILVVDSDTYPVHKGLNRVGRHDSCSVVIDHNTISKEHAEIEAGVGSKSTFISDLGSLNKTKLNEAILRPGRLYQLQDGDVVRFGSVKAVFKVAKLKAKNSVLSRNGNEFVIPETPVSVAKKVIPGTPDLSFDRSLTDGNRSSDLSVISGTQEVGNTVGRSSPRLCCEPISQRGSVRGKNLDLGSGDDAPGPSGSIDISDLETQKNFTVEDSDEENIFDMVTQKTDIHDDETQRFSIENIQTVKPSRYSPDEIATRSGAIEDLETQKFSNDDSRVTARSESTNDLETQKFTLNDVPHGSRLTVDGIEPRSDTINDLDTRNFIADKIESINDVETQKFDTLNKDVEDSETDEEGVFENSDDGVVDMFDAPTQLIRPPYVETKSPCEVQVENVTAVSKEEEKTEDPDTKPEENEESKREVTAVSVSAEEHVQTPVEVKSHTELEVNEEKRAAPNDSIESKLNHMFDEVNRSVLEEPTQMLTQQLENILESATVDRHGVRQRGEEIASTDNVDLQPSTSTNRDGAAGEVNDDDNIAQSDDEEVNQPVKIAPRKAFNAVVRVPELLSTQELFSDLPAINIFGTPSTGSSRGRIKVSPLSDVSDTPRSKKSNRINARNFSNGSKRDGSRESVESVDSKRTKSMKNTESKVAESRVTPVKEIQTPSKARGRKKSRIQNDEASAAANLEKTSPEVDEAIKAESRKGLPLKKRGSSITSSPSTPQKTVAEVVVTTVRIATRSNMKISAETGKKSTRLSAVDTPKVQEPKRQTSNSTIKVNSEKPESSTTVSPAKDEPLSRNKKNTRSRKAEDASSSGDTILKTEREPQPISSPRGSSRILRKKPLDTSAAAINEEVTPVKRARMSATVLPTNVTDRPRPAARRERGKIAKPNVPESSELEINQNESLPTRSRRVRTAANTSSNDSSRNSSLAVENIDNLSHQPSLESQEIQAILGVVDQEDEETRGRGASRYRKEMRVFPSHMTGNDFIRVEEDREKGFMGFSKVEISDKDGDNEFEKPVGRPERKKRPIFRPQLDDDDEDIAETNRKRSNPRRNKNADVVNKDNSLKPETSGVIVATGSVGSSNVKSHSKPTKKEKIVAETTKAKVPTPSVIAVEETTPKKGATMPVRNKRNVSRRVVDQAGKENVVEETSPKRGRKTVVEAKPAGKQNIDDDKASVSSSPLRRGRSSLSTPKSAATSSARIKHKILFTGLNDDRLVSIVNNLGGTVTEKPNDCTALVTDKVRRTYKFLCCMAMAVPIVSVDWLKESDNKSRFLDTGDFVLKDPVEEAKFGFNLRRSLVMATDDKLLEGYTVVLTPNTAPPPIAEMKGIIQACGGKALARPPTRWPGKSLIISRQEDIKNAKKFLTKAPKSVRLLSVEFILTGILRHELNFEEHKLEID